MTSTLSEPHYVERRDQNLLVHSTALQHALQAPLGFWALLSLLSQPDCCVGPGD